LGETVELGYWQPAVGRWQWLTGEVVGVLQEESYLAHYPITTRATLETLGAAAGPNALLVRWAAGVYPRRGVSRLRELLQPAQILTPETPGSGPGNWWAGSFPRSGHCF